MQPYSNQTPGVYTIEQNAFPNAVVGVATAVPAFIGYTEKAVGNGKDLSRLPTRIGSMQEFEAFFGEANLQQFKLTPAGNAADPALAVAAPFLTFTDPVTKTGTKYALAPATDKLFYLYHSVQLFYLNGGSTCYIISIGSYAAEPSDKKDFEQAIDSLKDEQDPTMVLCPDALRLTAPEYYKVAQCMLRHCSEVQSRVAILDVYGGALSDPLRMSDPIAEFRHGVGQNHLNYGIAYFPWVKTSVVSRANVSFRNLDEDALRLLQAQLSPESPASARATDVKSAIDADADAKATPTTAAKDQATLATNAPGLAKMVPKLSQTKPEAGGPMENIFDQAIALQRDALPGLPTQPLLAARREVIHNTLTAQFPDYDNTMSAIAGYLGTLPVAPAMAGVYTATDNNRGVWKAPANVSLNAVMAPTMSLSDSTQASLNVDAVSGKSINAIRTFPGLGVLVWGARTLDGNSQDWRYVNVRRTMIMIEQSVKLAARAYVFEANTANTWTTLRSMVNSFLFSLWKQGALFGSSPAEAYQVNVGLGSTMTSDDVLNGIMRVTVLVALVRPAEFILLTFEQQMPGGSA